MKIQQAFQGLNPVHRQRSDLPLVVTPELCEGLKNLYLKTDLGVVDCLGEVLAVGNFDDVLEHSTFVELPMGRFRILEVDTLIKAKEAMARPHDLIAVQHLKALKTLLPP